ncbi:MAG: family 10 glycosylhydrolase [Planctomycetes bacterium]|nr:family 10 glycosylhydrolase [Planctomycetota bacterium]
MPRWSGLAVLALGLVAALARADEVRAIWVTRYDYRTEEDVREIVARSSELGMTRILFQVRGNADAFYRSTLEPRSPRLAGAFDPLAVALEEAHRRGIEIEAWINVMPLWKGKVPPDDPAHLFRAHPEWVVVGSDGKPQALNDHYVCANPALPEVREHVARVAGEIAALYAVDGIHLDYIRYVTDLTGGLDFSHDGESLAAFGRDPKAAPEEWARFKEDRVTETVAAIRQAVLAARPGCRLTAAVFPTAESRHRVFQDAERWVREGLVDAVYPMIYTDDDAVYAARLKECVELLSRPGATGEDRRVLPGVGVHRHRDAARTRSQVEAARAAGSGGFTLFCYAAFFPSADDEELAERDAALRERRIEAIRAALGGSGR